jgi:2-methylcitrate dehydratase PrpD
LVPGLLALAEQQQLSGRAVLEAYVAGFEVMMRIAATVNFHHYEKGWHPTATLGVFGAAAAAARLMQLDATACANALGLAASFSSGIKENFGSIAKSIQVGNAASRGLLAAQLAAQGATAAQTALDGARGFFEVFNGAQTYNLQQLAIDPDHPELMRSGISFKRYACCGSTHVGIDAALRLRAQAGFDAQKIRSVRLEINARRIPHVNRPVLSEPLAAKFSLQYTVAAALCDGGVGLSHFTPEAITRPDLRALMAKVEIGAIAQTSEALGQPCRLRVQMHDGAELEVSLDGPLGREIEAYPTYMEQKFLDCASQALDMAASRRLFALLCEFENAPDVAALLAASLPLQANDQIPEAARRV